MVCHAEYRRAAALPCRGAFKSLTAHAAHPDELETVRSIAVDVFSILLSLFLSKFKFPCANSISTPLLRARQFCMHTCAPRAAVLELASASYLDNALS